MHRTELAAAGAILAIVAACQPIAQPWSPEMNAVPSEVAPTMQRRRADVLGSFMSYREIGSGRPIVLLHGNPTSSFVWRNVMPSVAPAERRIAPDLIGMGDSGKPESPYRYADHARYLDAWFDALGLRDVVVVGYDWGGVLAVDWARRHADRVRGVVVFETFLQPLHWADFPPQGAELFHTLRTHGLGEKLVLEENGFLPKSLENGVKHGLSDADRSMYYAPFPDPASRRPMLQWPRELPIDGDPQDVTEVVSENAAWLASTPSLPKLLLMFDGKGLSNSPTIVEWAKKTITDLTVTPLGAAGHHAPEDAQAKIADAINAWLRASGT